MSNEVTHETLADAQAREGKGEGGTTKPEQWAEDYAVEKLGSSAPRAARDVVRDAFIAGYLVGVLKSSNQPADRTNSREMNISLENVREIHAIAEALITALEDQAARRGITQANVLVDATINCLCYVMQHIDPPLGEEELLRRVTKYLGAADLSGAPAGTLS